MATGAPSIWKQWFADALSQKLTLKTHSRRRQQPTVTRIGRHYWRHVRMNSECVEGRALNNSGEDGRTPCQRFLCWHERPQTLKEHKQRSLLTWKNTIYNYYNCIALVLWFGICRKYVKVNHPAVMLWYLSSHKCFLYNLWCYIFYYKHSFFSPCVENRSHDGNTEERWHSRGSVCLQDYS